MSRVDQLQLFGTLEEAEAIAEMKHSLVRDQVVCLLQDGSVRGREAREAGVLDFGPSSKTQ